MDVAILSKIRHYCAYQERAHKEVRTKLLELGSRGLELENIIGHLIENNFLNEERFAQQYARGKFTLKKWGRIKITNALKFKGVSPYCIKKGMAEIDDNDYFDTLFKLAITKTKQVGKIHPALKRKKIYTYLMGKGYESNLINEVLNDIKEQGL